MSCRHEHMISRAFVFSSQFKHLSGRLYTFCSPSKLHVLHIHLQIENKMLTKHFYHCMNINYNMRFHLHYIIIVSTIRTN